jgi:hypothetical protein
MSAKGGGDPWRSIKIDLKEIKGIDELCRLEGNSVVFPQSHGYEISLETCDTHEKVLRWVYHIADKPWCTPEVLKGFITVACQASGINFDQYGPLLRKS